MSLSRVYVDGFLVDWEEGEYQAQVKSMRQRSEELKPRIPVPGGGRGGKAQSTAARAQAVRARLARTVRKVPEVMVKITSSCRGMTQIGRHLDYISRKGQIDLEDQDGFIVRGKDQIKDLKEDWRIGGPEEIALNSDRRDTLNIVFSMPAHTDEVSMKKAVRAFAAGEFAGHQYVFAYHTQATDPDPNPPAHPHVHLSVKTLGALEHRLNPRKADLQRWREGFAAQLRAHGIEANATSRLARLKLDRGDDRAIVALKAKGETVIAGTAPKSKSRAAVAKKLEQDRRSYYGLVADVLSQSDDGEDRKLGQAIAASLAPEKMPPDRAPPPPDRGR
jgi:hypothetical protein